MNGSESSGRDLTSSGADVLKIASSDSRLCRLCLIAAILLAFGKEALMFI